MEKYLEKGALNAHSVDLDGALFRRIPIQGYALLGLAKFGAKELFKAPNLHRNLDRKIVEDNRKLSHIARCLMPGALEFVERIKESSDLYINTGRPAHRSEVDRIIHKLKKHGIMSNVTGAYFKPDNVEAMISKGVALKELSEEYRGVTHTDDDISTVIPLAKIFNRITFNVIEDWTTGLLVNELTRLGERLPDNVHIYQGLKDIPV